MAGLSRAALNIKDPSFGLENTRVENTFRGVSTLSCFLASSWIKEILKITYHSDQINTIPTRQLVKIVVKLMQYAHNGVIALDYKHRHRRNVTSYHFFSLL